MNKTVKELFNFIIDNFDTKSEMSVDEKTLTLTLLENKINDIVQAHNANLEDEKEEIEHIQDDLDTCECQRDELEERICDIRNELENILSEYC